MPKILWLYDYETKESYLDRCCSLGDMIPQTFEHFRADYNLILMHDENWLLAILYLGFLSLKFSVF